MKVDVQQHWIWVVSKQLQVLQNLLTLLTWPFLSPQTPALLHAHPLSCPWDALSFSMFLVLCFSHSASWYTHSFYGWFSLTLRFLLKGLFRNCISDLLIPNPTWIFSIIPPEHFLNILITSMLIYLLTFYHIIYSSSVASSRLRAFFFNLFIFDGRIIALQYCVGFCHSSTWIRRRCTCVPSLLNLLPTSSHAFPPL